MKLEVGTDKTTVTSHEDNLRQTSPFFRAALDKQWKENTSGEIKLPEDETDVVTAYVDWLYSKTVSEAICRDNCEGELQPDFNFLISLYVFAEKVQDDRFADAALCQMLEQMDLGKKEAWYPGQPALARAYEGTPDGSPLRRLLACVWAKYLSPSWFGLGEVYPMEFMVDLAKQFSEFRGIPVIVSWQACKEDYMKVGEAVFETEACDDTAGEESEGL